MRPADVCGWTRYPSCSSTAISLRTVAEDTLTPGAAAMWVEPTGSAVAMYSCTTALRIAVFRSSSIWHSTLPSANSARLVRPATDERGRNHGGHHRDDAPVGQRPLDADVVADGARDGPTDRRRAEERDRGQREQPAAHVRRALLLGDAVAGADE